MFARLMSIGVKGIYYKNLKKALPLCSERLSLASTAAYSRISIAQSQVSLRLSITSEKPITKTGDPARDRLRKQLDIKNED